MSKAFEKIIWRSLKFSRPESTKNKAIKVVKFAISQWQNGHLPFPINTPLPTQSMILQWCRFYLLTNVFAVVSKLQLHRKFVGMRWTQLNKLFVSSLFTQLAHDQWLAICVWVFKIANVLRKSGIRKMLICILTLFT